MSKSMTRSDAAAIFGGLEELADAMGLKIRAVYYWPESEPLAERMRDNVACVAYRRGKLSRGKFLEIVGD